MDNKYNSGKIYRIVCNITGLVYIGSTCEPRLSTRLARHRSAYKRYINKIGTNYVTSFKIFEHNDYFIELVDYARCETKDELCKIEGQYIRDADCINQRIAGRSRHEYNIQHYQNNKEQISIRHRQYNQDNKEQISIKQRQHYQNNKEQIGIRHRQYNQDNKEQISIKQRQHYQNNKEQISIRHRQYNQDNKEQVSIKQRQHYQDRKEVTAKVQCDSCKSVISKGSLYYHKKTNICKKYSEIILSISII
jgi:hypothetical protein